MFANKPNMALKSILRTAAGIRTLTHSPRTSPLLKMRPRDSSSHTRQR
jgi:hypothetical protein